MAIRYYLGDSSNLDGLSTDEIVDLTQEFYEDALDLYEETLNDIHDPIEIGGSQFFAGQILRACDPIAFRCGASDFIEEIEV